MARYLCEANHIGEGITGLLREGGRKRREAIVEAVRSAGETLECVYYAFGTPMHSGL